MAMSYSYELQAAVYDRMTALEEQARGPKLPDFSNRAAAARAWADQVERAEEAERARLAAEEIAIHAIKTKAEIGSRREATSMATASVAVRKADALEDKLGVGKHYRKVIAIEWLPTVFDPRKLSKNNGYSQIGKKLTAISERLGYPTIQIPDEKYPNGVKGYHIDVVEHFRLLLDTDKNMLWQFRR
jgi:hypothetical protein